MNNYNIKSYIFIHDQDILLHCESVNNFNNLGNYIYVFLGNGNIDKLNNIKNIIIARDLPNNLENYPNSNST